MHVCICAHYVFLKVLLYVYDTTGVVVWPVHRQIVIVLYELNTVCFDTDSVDPPYIRSTIKLE